MTTESDTPRTDALASDGWSGDAICISAEHARQLERELNQTRIQLDAWHEQFGTTQLDHAIARLEQAEKERNQAKAELDMRAEPNPNGTIAARMNWWKIRCDELSDEFELFRKQMTTSALMCENADLKAELEQWRSNARPR